MIFLSYVDSTCLFLKSISDGKSGPISKFSFFLNFNDKFDFIPVCIMQLWLFFTKSQS